MALPNCYGKRPFPDVEGKEVCIKCEKCEDIDGRSRKTIRKVFPNVNII